MDRLKQRILADGVVMGEDVLQLDSFLNHQIDPVLMLEIGREFARRFSELKPTKILTVESSGIAIAFATAIEMSVPVVFARKKLTRLNDQDAYLERVPAFTKGIVTDLAVSKSMIDAEDRLLIIDDFLANGNALKGLVRIAEYANAEILAVGIVVEKTFQSGGQWLRDRNIRMESLAQIDSLTDGKIQFS